MSEAGGQWLNAKERRAWLALLGLLAGLPVALDNHLQQTAGLSTFEYLVLAQISEQPERTVQMKSLAELAQGSLSRLSHAMTRLERRGLVERGPSLDDGRVTVASLTELGWQTVVDVAPQHVAAVRSLVFDRLTERQVDQLAVIASRISPRRPPTA